MLTTLHQRLALALMASGERKPITEIHRVDLDRVIPLTRGMRHAKVTSRDRKALDPLTPVEVLLDSGIVVLTRVRHDPDDGILIWLHGFTGPYARSRARVAGHGSRWSADGWWRVVDPTVYDPHTYDWADPVTGQIGQCWRRDEQWAQAPLGDEPVILAWDSGKRSPVEHYWDLPIPAVDRTGLS